jgi:hypothetical protein
LRGDNELLGNKRANYADFDREFYDQGTRR